MKKKIGILGSTGSIGENTVKIIQNNKKDFDVVFLSTNKNVKKLLKQSTLLKPKNVIIFDKKKYTKYKKKFINKNIKVFNSFNEIKKKTLKKKIDYIMCAITGLAGLDSTLNCIDITKNVAIANKESIICAWNLIEKKLIKNKTKFIPVDSEHFSIWSLLKNESINSVEKVIITASGGPFLNYKLSKLNNVKPKEAIKHPNWRMGKKISIDSATLMNKVFEIIEAQRIFKIDINKFDILIHPNSYVHSIIKFTNGQIKILAHDTDMKIPIFNSIYQDELKKIDTNKININILNDLEFKKVNLSKYPSVKFLNKINNKNTLFETVLISANDELVSLFSENLIKFLDINRNLMKIIKIKKFSKLISKKPKNISDIINLSKEVRLKTRKLCIRWLIKMKILIKILIILSFTLFSANSEIIKVIEVQGNSRVSNETIKVFSGIEINQDVSRKQLNNVIKNLFETNYFKDVSITVDNNILYIKVLENPIIQSLIFDGIKNKRILKILSEQVEMKEKKSFVEVKVKLDEQKITNILRTNGYYFSKVSSKLKNNDNNTVDLIFDIDLGTKAFIKKISFIGDKKIKDNKLKKIIVSEEAKFWKFISPNKFLDLKRIKLDENLLYNYYRNKGYYNVSIESSSAKIINDTDFELIFNINAGKKYYFGKIDLVIPLDYSIDSFKNITEVQKKLEGKVYSLNKIKKILDKIDDIALTKEFEFINAKYDEILKDDKIYLTIKLEESEKYYIERINIYGNYITAEHVLRNSLLVDEGDPFNEILVNKSINEIKSRRIFDKVNKSVSDGSSNKYKIININVDEKPTGEISAGAGTGTSGSTVSFGIKENNYMGDGIKLNTNVSVSDTGLRGNISINNPNYKNSDKSLITNIEATQIDQMTKFGYKSTKTGFSIGTLFEQYDDIYFSPNISNYLETLKTSSAASDAKKKQKGEYFDSNFNYGLTLNKLNQNYQPSAGFKSSFYQTLPIYSDDLSIVNSYDFAKYYSPNENAILSFKFLVQSINSLSGDDVRISKRLYLPHRRLKGFEFGKVGPKDGNDFIGGNYASSINFATTLPGLLKDLENFDFSFFVDAGNVWGVDYSDIIDDNSKIRSSTGLAVDWLTPIGPLSFSFAQPITKADTDKTETFRFDIGTTF